MREVLDCQTSVKSPDVLKVFKTDASLEHVLHPTLTINAWYNSRHGINVNPGLCEHRELLLPWLIVFLSNCIEHLLDNFEHQSYISFHLKGRRVAKNQIPQLRQETVCALSKLYEGFKLQLLDVLKHAKRLSARFINEFGQANFENHQKIEQLECLGELTLLLAFDLLLDFAFKRISQPFVKDAVQYLTVPLVVEICVLKDKNLID